MTETRGSEGVIPSGRVRRLDQPVMVDCGDGHGGSEAMTVIPVVDGDRVAGIEVRCRCGASLMIECVYQEGR